MIQDAYKVLRMTTSQGLRLDKVTFTILITKHCKQSYIIYALDLFNRMAENGCHPDIDTYTTLIATYCQQRQMEES